MENNTEMKINFLVTIKLLIFMLICSTNISSCCKKECFEQKTNQKEFGCNGICVKNEYFSYPIKIQKKIKELHNINIIYFNFNQYNILPQFTHILQEHAHFLYNNPNYKIVIEGHTDERGTPEYNIALGERRANSVKIYLQTQGVLDNQISIISYGKEKPVLIGHSEKEYSKNRRAIIVY